MKYRVTGLNRVKASVVNLSWLMAISGKHGL